MTDVKDVAEVKEVYLEADKEIPGQHYVALSFLSPNKVLANKSVFFFSEFLKDYEVQYKIRATESFVMSQVTKVQEAASKVQDVLDNLVLRLQKKDATVQLEDLSGSLATVKDLRVSLTRDTAADLEAHVKAEMSDFKTTTLNEAYDTYLFKNKKRLEDKFFTENEFRTTVQGLKVRGVYDTYNEALARAKTLQKLDPSFNVYVGQVGFWLPWDPEPHDIQDQEYADDQLNTLMKKYKDNESQRDEFYAQTKKDRLVASKTRGVPATVGPAGATEAPAIPSDMFGAGEDLAIARKKEREAAKNTVTTA